MPERVLADTSVWVRHLRSGDVRLASLLDEAAIVCHPYILGELACGNLTGRSEVLGLLAALPQAPVLDHNEALRFIDVRSLMGRGLGYIDVHLLGSAVLSNALLWTDDRSLREAASAMERDYRPD